MESFVYPPYSLYQGYRGPMAPGCGGGGPKPRQPSWKQSKGSGACLGVPPAEPLPLGGADCADSYRRAQLKALLSQVSPGLAPRLRKPGPAGRWLPALSVAVSRVQFLEQKYGYFHCKDCRTRWESAYVWCISGSNKVYFKQLCRKCQKGFNPYKVEAIQCQTCSKTHCSCPQKKRHIDLKRPHRQELCGRCKGKRLSCDNTYSFKYIV
ncbi:PREDICTED: ZAR1-like protein [Crocodylus porosus]|uniref:ZAR1-like protein n=1 Tax=Crocodylus porosus TaxID=8502 RepID=UPI00093CE9C5|nr:PREDICTED: ZAR1-like protein [Crocodylus porosus]